MATVPVLNNAVHFLRSELALRESNRSCYSSKEKQEWEEYSAFHVERIGDLEMFMPVKPVFRSIKRPKIVW